MRFSKRNSIKLNKNWMRHRLINNKYYRLLDHRLVRLLVQAAIDEQSAFDEDNLKLLDNSVNQKYT